MNHFHTNTGAHAKQLLPQPKPSIEAAPPVSLSQSELRDIVLAILG
ncbi:hypothetical protein [Roseococcus sp. SYP-B2431]|nr:hypothetical protein [Roseococcus sp. SYP-B2431]